MNADRAREISRLGATLDPEHLRRCQAIAARQGVDLLDLAYAAEAATREPDAMKGLGEVAGSPFGAQDMSALALASINLPDEHEEIPPFDTSIDLIATEWTNEEIPPFEASDNGDA